MSTYYLQYTISGSKSDLMKLQGAVNLN